MCYNRRMKVVSVTQVTRYIKALIDGDEELEDLLIEGEISNFGRATSGHCYFTLKDTESEIRCVMWRSEASRLLRLPDQGDWVEAHGYVSVYERGGVYQFYVDALERGGVGAAWREFQELKERLQAEGLFDAERKRSLPKWPHRVGVVTSPTGAALRDILNVLQARYPLVEVVLSPSLVQGPRAPDSLVRAIERLNKVEGIDVIIVARGGGSLEDLWAFNDERVARAIAAVKTPVVSGVGHETDFTIADFVADARAPTPSAAAAAVVPDMADLSAQIGGMAQRLALLASQQVGNLRQQLQSQERLLRLYDPRKVLAEHRQRIDDLVRRVGSVVEHHIALQRTQLDGARASLQALNPHWVLKRGYAVVQDAASGVTIQSVAQVYCGEDVAIHLQDGRVGATVTEFSTRAALEG